ncbi:MAG TPA: ABC transporter substrate-binding protein, partial [Aggregatilineales bacterium]|nr:ABC transporter substrate-binding protein [Aggregatilineales bacterium]
PTAQRAFAQATRSGTLRVGWTPPVSLDPALYNDAPDISLGVAVYDYLFTLDQKSNLVPGLATSSKVNSDGTVFTLALQSGVKFHDGSAFTADDVKFTFQRLMDPAIKSPAAGLFSGVDKIDVVDPLTIAFTLKAPSAVFLSSLADYHTVILNKNTKDPKTEFNGTGPFKTSADKVDITDRATLVANENYWKPGQPKVAGLELIFVQEITALVQALKGGQIDWMARIPVGLYTDLKNDNTLVASSVPTNQFPNIRIRSDKGHPGEKAEVRKAIRQIIDRDALNKAVYQGLATPGRDTPVGPLYGALYSEATPFPPRDVAAAKKLLADAGYPNGLKIDFYVPHGEFNSDELAQVVQQQLKEAGIDANLQSVPANVYYGDGPNNWLKTDLGITNWASRPDPQSYLDLLFKSDGAYNEAHYSNPDLDKLIDQARSTVDAKQRADVMAQIQKILIEDGPSVIPYYQPLLSASSKKVTGITVTPDPGFTSFANAAIGS